MCSNDVCINYNTESKKNKINYELPKINSKVLGWENSPVNIEAINTGIVANLPIVLADFNIEFVISSSFQLPYEVSYIRKVINNIEISETKFMQETNVFLIKGILNKKIFYNTFNPINVISSLGDINNKVIRIPFEFTTSINTLKQDFILYPNNKETFSLDSSKENRFLTITKTYYNSHYCEIERCDMIDSKDSILINKTPCIRMPLGIKEIFNIKNEIKVNMRIKLLNKVDVYIPKSELTN